MMIHKHKWQKRSEAFNEPKRAIKVSNLDEDSWNRLVHGFTVVTFKCSRCPQEKYVTVIGRTQ